MTRAFNTIGIAGSGTMGAGIAQVCAMSGYKTFLYDISEERLENATLQLRATVEKGIKRQKLSENALDLLENNLSTTHHLTAFGEHLDLVIEAVPEDLSLKQDLLAKLDSICPDKTCFASNTSSFSITALGAATNRPKQVAGLHFFNPVSAMKLVEVIQGKETSETLIQNLYGLAESLGKTPVKVKDTSGFIVNRVARSFYGEALRLLSEGVASVETIDQIMREEGGFRMGPFELMDLIGIDVNYAVSLSVYEAYFQEPRFKPHPIQRQMVESGHLGRKTGRGFYQYD